MASARFAWGIDIGNRALKAIRLIHAGDALRIDDFDIIEHEQILSNAGDNRDAYIRRSLNTFAQRHSLKGGVASVGVSGQASFARFIKLPPVERRKIPEIVRFEAIQQIPFPLEDVEWSYQLFESPSSPDVEVGIFAMRKDLVDKHLRFFMDADMKVSTVQMNPLAVYNAMQFDGRLNEMTMIIDMGAETTDLIIADNESVWLRSISIGGNTFTEALVKAFKLNFVKAEELKRTAGTSKYTRQIFQAMRPIFGDLVTEIQRSMGFFSSVRRETRIKKVIALGGTFRLPNLLRYLQQNLQLEVERVDSYRGGAPSDSKAAAVFNENVLSLAGAYGLAIQAMGEGKIQSSLLPESIRRERMWKEKTKWFAAAAALMLAGTGVAYGSVYLSGQATSSELKDRNNRIEQDAKSLSAKWDEVEQSGAAQRDLIKQTYGLLDYRGLWANLIQDIRGCVPVPQPDVAKGLLAWDAKLVKLVPRGERNLLLLEDILPVYNPNIGQALAMLAASGAAGTPVTVPAGELRGFMVTVHCTTPNAMGPGMIKTEFLPKLAALNFANDPSRRYIVLAPTVIESKQLQGDATRLAQIQAMYKTLHPDAAPASGGTSGVGGAPGMSRMMPGMPPVAGGMPMPFGAAGGNVAVEAKTLDPLTEEDVTSDFAFTVTFVVLLDPPASMVPVAPATPVVSGAATGK